MKRPGDAGRCRVCVKAMKPDEYFRECTECGLKVCDDCASYSNNADGNEPFKGKYVNHKGNGVYVCVCCGTELFRSDEKFDSGSGWPSFYAALDENKIIRKPDYSLGTTRTEIKCANVSWRCSVCRRRGVAIIARRVQPGIEQSEVLEGLGCETTIRKSPDARRLQNSGRADSETEVLLLAPKPSDVRRHSDVPLRDIAKFQASVSAAASQHDLGLTVSNMPGEKAKSSNDIGGDGSGGPNISITVPVPTPGKPPPDGKGSGTQQGKDKPPAKASAKGATMKRQRSYERGASEGALNLPANARGRRASCDMRGMDATSLLNNNTIQPRGDGKNQDRASTMGIPGLNEKDLQRLQFQHQQHLQQQTKDPSTPQQQHHPNHPQQQQHHQNHPQQQQHHQNHPQSQQQHHQNHPQQPPQQQHHQNHPQQQNQQQHHQNHPQQQQMHNQQRPQHQYQQQQQQPQQYQQQPQYQPQQQQYQQQQQPQYQQQHNQYQQQPQQQQSPQQQQNIMGRGKAPPSDLAIGNDMRRRSVQIYNTSTPKQATTPRSCASLDAEAIQKQKQKEQLQQQQHVIGNGVKRQGSSTDGEAIKIVIDDVDSTAAKTDNNLIHKGQSQSGVSGSAEDYRQRVIRLRRDPQDRGYQTRGYGLRVVGGCNSPGHPGNLRARVARVTPGSGADFAGIRRGDIVLTWNGVKLSNMTFEEVCKVLDTSGDSVELNIASLESDIISVSTVPENEPTQDWEASESNIPPEAESLSVTQGADQFNATSPTGRRQLPRLPPEGRIQLRLFHDEVHNTLEISVANIAFGNDDCTTIDLQDIIITLRIGEKLANTRWNQCVLFTKVSPEDLFDSWLVLELQRGPDFLGECHVDMGRVSLDDRPVWFPFSAKGSSSHRGSISQIVSPGGNTPPSARELARRLRMRMAAGSQSQSEEQDDSSGQSSPCATSLLRPEVAWEMLGTLGPPSANLTSRSAPTSRRGSAQSDRGAIGMDGLGDDGRGSAPSTPALPRSLPPSRRGSFAFAVEQVINQGRRGSVAFPQRVPDMFMRQLPDIPDGSGGVDPAMLRNRRNSAWNPREVGFDRRSQFERTDSLRAMANQPRRTSEATQSFRDVVFEARARLAMQPKRPDPEEWRQQQWAPQ